MKWWGFLLFGFAVFIVSLFFDDALVLFFTQFRSPILDSLALFFSYTLVQVLVFFALPFLVLWFSRRDSAWLFAIGFGLVSLITYFLKLLVMRPRPFAVLAIPLLASLSYSLSPSNSSFPSFHASSSFSALAALRKSFFRWFFLVLALLSVFLRLYAGVHYLSDVVAGSIIGYSFTALVFWLDKRHGFLKKWKKTV